ncbi:alpha/beta hydrolase [Microbacterium horticulturae]|uniref:Alpha/beta hydrolase n=1 Tax=Microbacterium horticulturae TaxID=3028316 RepID=A0ABY8C1G2_9MICO|nr:alpha/beta hydrolase [Microbacterium sp. KACC 23027]WEG09572.1 alpha/beta hydrolase [Microbacterium sp. KACC 23027]
MSTSNPKNIALEPAAQAFVDATANPPFLYQLAPEDGRKAVDGVQDEPIWKPEIDEEWITVEGGPTGSVVTRIVKPKGATGVLPVVLYTHGAGWVFGDAHTHDRLVRDLAVGTGAAVVFPEYDRAPEHQYPVQNEQSYAVAQWVVQHGAEKGLDGSNVAIAGDSVGGNMAIALNLMAEERGDVKFKGAVLFYPVTDATFDTESYKEFADGYFLALDGMKWFWDQYTTSEEERAQITVSPLRATEEQLAFFPPTLVINGEADVLRDEGEAFAAKLRRAGVDVTQVRYAGIIHDFVMVNSMHKTHAAKAAVAQAIAHLKASLSA